LYTFESGGNYYDVLSFVGIPNWYMQNFFVVPQSYLQSLGGEDVIASTGFAQGWTTLDVLYGQIYSETNKYNTSLSNFPGPGGVAQYSAPITLQSKLTNQPYCPSSSGSVTVISCSPYSKQTCTGGGWGGGPVSCTTSTYYNVIETSTGTGYFLGNYTLLNVNQNTQQAEISLSLPTYVNESVLTTCYEWGGGSYPCYQIEPVLSSYNPTIVTVPAYALEGHFSTTLPDGTQIGLSRIDTELAVSLEVGCELGWDTYYGGTSCYGPPNTGYSSWSLNTQYSLTQIPYDYPPYSCSTGSWGGQQTTTCSGNTEYLVNQPFNVTETCSIIDTGTSLFVGQPNWNELSCSFALPSNVTITSQLRSLTSFGMNLQQGPLFGAS
jgi:hypothetical protein